MTLREYLAAEQIRQADLAKRWGLPESTLSDILRGRRDPSMEMARKIKRLSGGAVTLESWDRAA